MTATDRVVRNCRTVWIKRNLLGIQFENASVERSAHPPSAASPKLTHPHRQFMEYLRSGNWVAGTALPDRPKVIARLIENGWIECKNENSNSAYRITAAGLAAKEVPVQVDARRDR
jgi:hypothetical protein